MTWRRPQVMRPSRTRRSQSKLKYGGARPGFIAFLSALAEDERQRILKRTNDGRVEALKRGARFGRKPKLSAHQQVEAKQRLAKGETCRAIARSFNVHHATISRLE